MRKHVAGLAGAVMASVVLVGCSSAEDEQPTVVMTTVMTTQSSATTSAPESTTSAAPQPTTAVEPQCSGLTGGQALNQWVGEVPTMNGWQWNTEYASTETYDECLPLSYITMTIDGATASSPYQIMLFHNGEYLGTTLAEPRGFSPRIVRLADDAIQVTYRFPLAGESNAMASGTAVSQFTWDDAQGQVVQTGEYPPA